LRTTFPHELEERYVTVKGKLELLDEYAVVVEDDCSAIVMAKEELEAFQKMENLAREMHSKLNLDDGDTKKTFDLCKALSRCGGSANRQRLGMILGISEKTIDRIFAHSNTIRLKTGKVWNPYFETESSPYPAVFHSRPKTALTFFGQCLITVHEGFRLNEERERIRRRRSERTRLT
jgi:hypothetical protein